MICWVRHAWTEWFGEIRECPDDRTVVVEEWWRSCRRCHALEEEEEVLSCLV